MELMGSSPQLKILCHSRSLTAFSPAILPEKLCLKYNFPSFSSPSSNYCSTFCTSFSLAKRQPFGQVTEIKYLLQFSSINANLQNFAASRKKICFLSSQRRHPNSVTANGLDRFLPNHNLYSYILISHSSNIIYPVLQIQLHIFEILITSSICILED